MTRVATTTSNAPAAAAVVPPLYTRSFLLSVLASHAFFISYNMSIASVPGSLIGQPAWVIGLVVGALGVTGMLMRPIVGVLLDGGNRMRWVRIGALGSGVAFVGYSLGLGPWAMLGFRLIHGIATACFTVSMLAVVSGALPPLRRGMGVGFYQTSGAAAQLYSAPLAIWLVQAFSFEVSFLFSAAMTVIALVAGTLAGDPKPPPPAQKSGGWMSRGWVSPSALKPALVFLSVTAPWGAVTAFLLVFASDRHIENAGFFYTVVAFSQVAARLGVGWLADKLSPAKAVTPALICACIGLLVLASAHDTRTMMIAGLLYGLGLASTQTSIMTIVVDRTHPSVLGSAAATYTMAWDVGLVLGGVLFGFVVNATSPATTFAILAIFPAIGTVFFLAQVAFARPKAPALDGVEATPAA